MFKHFALSLTFILLITPAVTHAADESAREGQLAPLYAQLASLLQQELAIMQDPSQTYLSIHPVSGMMPFFATFIMHNPTGTEGINFGDGHTTGTLGCTKNTKGWCDLSKPVAHTYQLPGFYTVHLFRHLSLDQVQIMSTSTIYVTRVTSTQYNPNQ